MNIKSEKGITLVALIVSIIVMIILATVTLNTTFTAYDTTKAQKFKSQMRVLQEGVNSFYTDWQVWTKDKEIEYRDMLRNETFKAGNSNSISEEMKLKENSELPEYFYESYAGIDEYLEYKKDTYDYEIKGAKLSKLNSDAEINTECFDEVNEKMVELLGASYEINNPNTYFYHFDENDIEYFFGIKSIDMPIYINFENMVLFTSKPIRINGANAYTLYAFEDQNEIILNDTKSTMEGASILVDVKANYGTSQKITLTLESYDISSADNKNDFVDYRIRKAYYQNVYTQTATDSNSLLKNASWFEVDELKECEYSEDGKSVSFIIYESGMYKFRLEDMSGAYTIQMKRNVKTNVKNPTNQYSYEKIKGVDTNGDGKIDQEATYNITLCNAPVLNEDMIPVKWVYDDDSKVNGKWVICTTIDPEWYNYGENAKMWANVMLVHDTKARTLTKGTELSESEMGSMFVWVPRFDVRGGIYSIRFMRGTSSTNTFGNENQAAGAGDAYNGFGNNLGKGWDVKLRGLWYAKYDTTLEENETQKSINTSSVTDAKLYDNLYSAGQNFKPTVKPYRITWRNVSFTSAFSQALMYYTNLPSASKNKDLNSHMMTGSEFDILNAIAADGKFGVGKDADGTPKLSHNTSNKYAGGSDGHGGYTVANFKNQSTNGNMTGIFDFEGTTNVMIPEVTTAFGDNKNQQLLNTLGEIINQKGDTSYSNKYMEIKNSTVGTIRIEEEPNRTAIAYKTLNTCASDDTGFRIVMSNSPSGDRSNFVYTSSNLSNTDTSLPGFYITDSEGNYIRNANGEFRDENGESTYISWDEMINRNWIKIEKGNEYAGSSDLYDPNDRIVVMGDYGDGWKNLQGIWVISDSVNIIGRKKLSDTVDKSGFTNRNKLLEVQMPDTITEISESAFSNCTNLKSVKMSQKLIRIGSSAFWVCDDLVNIALPDSLEVIEDNVFHHCSALESITIPENVESIGINAFANCGAVSNLEIKSKNEMVIGEYAFAYMSNVKTLKIPSNVKEIKPSAFTQMKALENLVIEEGVEIIGEGAFSACEKLKKVVFPSTVKAITLHTSYTTAIGQCGLFEECSNLEEVDFSKTTIEDLQNDVFYNCEKLKKLKLPPTLKRIGKDFAVNCSLLEEIEFPSSIERIERLAFGGGNIKNPVPILEIHYKGTKSMWDSIVKEQRKNSAYNLYTDYGWNENINITVYTGDNQIITYRPR